MIDRETKNTIITISASDKRYPETLRAIHNPPKELYCLGDVSLLTSVCIAVVGTRTPSQYGMQAAKMFAKGLANEGLTVVSGLARGIDSAAHSATLDADGKTIAVLAGGFNKIYPAENKGLAQKIAERGLLISEYPPDMTAAVYNFPVRNRIISGLSKGVLIIEAGERSGTLNTASHALNQGRELFVIPGNIFSKTSKGTNNLLKEAQGAIVTDTADILAVLGMTQKSAGPRREKLSEDEKKVLALIDERGEVHFDEIAEKFENETGTALVLLSTMELKGLISKTDGNFFVENK